jgi:hypothetical protein
MTSQIGSWSTSPTPLILTIQYHPIKFRLAIAELVARLARPFILLAPTADHVDARCQETLAHARARFFALDSIVQLNQNGALQPRTPPDQLFVAFTPDSHKPKAQTKPPAPRYALRKGLGVWKLSFDGKEADIKHERGLLYVAWLLYNPPEHPIHAIDLAAKIPEIYRQQLGLPPIQHPDTGRVQPLASHSRIQERSLALDDAQAVRGLLRRQNELEAILDDENQSEPIKHEALVELETIAEFQRRHTRSTKDTARHVSEAIRKAVRRLHRHLCKATDHSGHPHPAIQPFASHILHHILNPSTSSPFPGCLTYQPPQNISWAI